ncbi:ABC transporter permease [Diaminobutyricibacter sp. McL0618]|uniref:ABC transporter permease n=1 Tax=Leifsonia sp. McL0618 TaxID=3415677 RepID=UPI003CF01D57
MSVARSEHRSSILVAALSCAFGTTLLVATTALSAVVRTSPISEHSTAQIALFAVAIVFIVIAVYVGSVVTANTFATIIAGRTRTIALMRVLGSSASSQRRAVSREGLLVGVYGAIIGVIVGLGVGILVIRVAVALKAMPDLSYSYVSPVLLAPPLIVVLTTWAASWVGSRRVLLVTPMQALGGSVERNTTEVAVHRGKHRSALVLVIVGLLLIAFGIVVGLHSPFGVLISMLGGIASFSGIVLGAEMIIPRALRLTGRLMGTTAPAKLAAANAVRYPERSARTAIGLVIGVTLVTMFIVASQSFQTMIVNAQAANPDLYAGAGTVLNVIAAVFSVLVGFSALIAAIGVVNNLSLSGIQRQRELGLLRALGFSRVQVRQTIVAEAGQITITAVLLGLILGTFYGWVGAQSLLGDLQHGVVSPTIPWALIVIAAAVAVALTLIASIAPTRRALKISPVSALAIE